jgi:hypothetical protein
MTRMTDAEVNAANIEDPSFPPRAFAVSTRDDPWIYYMLLLFLFGVGVSLIVERINWKKFGSV